MGPRIVRKRIPTVSPNVNRSNRIAKRPVGRPRTKAGRRKVDQVVVGTERPSNFMSLPTEIRLKILREALSQSASIHDVKVDREHNIVSAKNYHFVPEILRTCKQVYFEGLPILRRENTFDIVISTLRDHQDVNIIFPGCKKDHLPSWLDEVQHFNITVRGHHATYLTYMNGVHLDGYTMDDDESFDDRCAIHCLCQQLVDTVDLKRATISINLAYDLKYDEDATIREKVLEPFAFLRGVKKATVTGVPHPYARYLEAKMMSQEPVEHIWSIKIIFSDWCDRWTGEEASDLGNAACDAINECNFEEFKEERDKVVGMLGVGRHRSTTRMLEDTSLTFD